jgi:OmpA-OmpF porin, OOP family
MRLVILLLAALAWMAAPTRVGAMPSGRGQSTATDLPAASPDGFTVVRTVTVNFGKDKSDVSRSQKEQLRQLIAHAQILQDYMIAVAAYAPPPGAEPVSQKLSMQRASAITAILRQAGVSLAHVIVTAAMGGPNHASPDLASKGQADDRRVVVTLLQTQ